VEMEQGVQSFVDTQDHVSAAPPIAAVRTTSRNELFPPEVDAAVAPVARSNCDPCRVDEHRSHDRNAVAFVRPT